MKKKQHSTSNIQHSTSNDRDADVWEFNEGDANGRKFDLEERLLEFASAIIDLSEKLPSSRAGNHVAGQILRSGTSPYPNHGEAEAAESREDFIHKLKICLKELRETRRWARLINRKQWAKSDPTLPFVLRESEELISNFLFQHSDCAKKYSGGEMQSAKPDSLSCRRSRLTLGRWALNVECSMFSLIKKWASFVRFSHTVFALPFALAAMVVAARDNRGWPGWRTFRTDSRRDGLRANLRDGVQPHRGPQIRRAESAHGQPPFARRPDFSGERRCFACSAAQV